MKVVIFLLSLVLFVASCVSFGYASEVGLTSEAGAMWLVMGGIVGVSAAFAIPFHLLEKFD